ncbi:MAG: 23S rRNA (guanosine(2251)-2'-O)-methyltransferase RlmB [Candidatus Omnitrophota bacterium]
MNKDKMFLYGKNSILERLKVNPGSVKKVYLQDNFDIGEILKLVKKNNIPSERVSERGLEKIKRAARLQGIIAEVERFIYTDFDKLLDGKLSIIFLDNLNDPHNLGSIVRIAACFGGFGLVIPKHRSCEVTDAVMHVSSGGENFVPISLVTNITSALMKAKQSGYWVVGATVDNGEDITKADLPYPLCLVLGSEGRGIRHGIEKHLDKRVTIPMKGKDLSFNVAMAGAIFCHEISNRRKEQ